MAEHRRYKVTDDRFGRLSVTLREKARLTQAKVAAAVGVSERSIQQWESGVAFPAGENLKKLIALYVEHGAFRLGAEREEAYALWEQVTASASRQKGLFDEIWFDRLLASRQASQRTTTYIVPQHLIDWGEAPDTMSVSGREHELATLANWALHDRCWVIAVLGMGGIGKTTLTVRFTQQVAEHFTRIVWRSLHNAPLLHDLLADCSHALAEQPIASLATNTERAIHQFIESLRQQRCLVVLDHVETVLAANTVSGNYRAGYENYRSFFQRVAESAHQSCLLLTSREMLSELEHLEGNSSPVHTLKLVGLTSAASQMVLEPKGLIGTAADWDVFVQHYAGTPLALKIAAATVHDLFGGDLHAFLREGPMTLSSLQHMLDDQFVRLTPLEQDVLVWLAVERNLVDVDTLYTNFVGTVVRNDLLGALKSLRRRSLLERDDHSAAFTLQPVVLEYVSEWLVAQISSDIIQGTMSVLAKYALLKGQSADYIRESQRRMLVQPLLDRLIAHFGVAQAVEAHILTLIDALRGQPETIQGYAPGTLINLLVALRGELRTVDCSRLVLRQAHLAGVDAQDASFANVIIRNSSFTTPLATIASMSLSPNGCYLAVGSFSGQVQLWDTANGTLIWAVKAHSRMAWALAFSPNSALLASGGYQGQVKLWNVATGRLVRALQAHTAWVRTAAWNPDGTMLATADDDGVVRLWPFDPATNEPAANAETLAGHHGPIWSLAWHPNGARLITGGSDGTLRVWEIATGTALQVLAAHTGGVFSVAFQPSGEQFASGGEADGRITLWDAATNRLLATHQRANSGGLVALAFNPEGTLLASGSGDGVIEVWESGSSVKRWIATLEGHEWLIGAVSFAANGLLASVAYGGQVKLWQADRGRLVRTIHGYSRLITTLAWSPQQSLLVQGDASGMLRVWDTERGECVFAIHAHSGPIWAVAWSPNGATFATGGDDRAIKLWHLAQQRCIQQLHGHTAIIWALAISSDGATLASGGGDQTIRLYNLHDPASDMRVLAGSASQVVALAFRADNSVLASGHLNGEIGIWQPADGARVQTLRHTDRPVGALHWADAGNTLITSSNQTIVQWWHVASGTCFKTLSAQAAGNWFKAAHVSASAALLATGSGDQTVQLWPITETDRPLQPRVLAGHAGQIWAVAFSPQGGWLASADDQGMIIIWDCETGTPIRQLTTDRPYERMSMHGIQGLNAAQHAGLHALGAIDTAPDFRTTAESKPQRNPNRKNRTNPNQPESKKRSKF